MGDSNDFASSPNPLKRGQSDVFASWDKGLACLIFTHLSVACADKRTAMFKDTRRSLITLQAFFDSDDLFNPKAIYSVIHDFGRKTFDPFHALYF
jgi:hypothetical protein